MCCIDKHKRPFVKDILKDKDYLNLIDPPESIGSLTDKSSLTMQLINVFLSNKTWKCLRLENSDENLASDLYGHSDIEKRIYFDMVKAKLAN